VIVAALPMGPLGLLLETEGDPVVVATRVRAAVAGLVDVVPAARTVLVTATDREVIGRVRELVDAGVLTASPAVTPVETGSASGTATDITSDLEPVEVPVRYDGPDLAEVAARTGLSPDEVALRHIAGAYRVAFCGFAPGFAYLEGLDQRLWLPRRETPRTRVPAGSVAIAAGYSAVYPTASPGGWHLLGTTTLAVWDADRTPPALLAPGTVVRFVAAPATRA
jgi:KipI family sensor histidine kinase inhibitor